MSSFNKVLYITFAGALVLAGCTNYNKADALRSSLPAEWRHQHDQPAQALPGQWWSAFDDLALNTLIERALEQAPDRRLALARIVEARALAGNASAQMLPGVRGGLDGQRGDHRRYRRGCNAEHLGSGARLSGHAVRDDHNIALNA